MKQLWLHTFFLLLLSLPVAGQQARQYSFTHYGVSSGLASNEATACLQDRDGFIWIGTTKGLQRFDGKRYLTFSFERGNPGAIPYNIITQLLLDKDANLWVLTADGNIGTFNTKNFVYHAATVTPDSAATLLVERQLTMDDEGNLFLIYLHRGLLTYNRQKNEFASRYNFVRMPNNWLVTDCRQQPGTKKYWITGPRGFAIYDRATNRLSYAGHNEGKEAVIDNLAYISGPTRLLFDKQNRLWFDSWDGVSYLYAYDLQKNKLLLSKYSFSQGTEGYYELRGLLQQENGTIWIKGLSIFGHYLEKENRFQMVYNGYQNEQSIDYDRVNDFFEDRDQNVWVATNNNGMYFFNPSEQFFTNIRQINRRTKLPGKGGMMSFLLGRDKTLFAGAWEDGLYRYDSSYRMLPIDMRGVDPHVTWAVWSMCYSPDSNRIWMGAQPGIIEYRPSTGAAKYYNPPILQGRTVRQVATDKLGNLWMGTQSLGVFKWNAGKRQRDFADAITAFKDIPVCQIRKIFVDSRGIVWFATSDYGAYAVDPATDSVVTHLTENGPAEKRIISNGLVSIVQYDDSTLVISGKGVDFYNIRQDRIVKSIGLPESQAANIAAVETDRNGYLWISLSNGIYRLNPKNRIFIHFDRVDGIMNDHFALAASYKLPDGRIIFGADNQLVVFDPHKVLINDPAPNITITGFKLMNQALLVDSVLKKDRIELKPESNSITIEMSGFGYGGAFIIMYKLEGLDKDWITADDHNQAIYSYLPPGNYTFLAKAQDAEGNPSRYITRLNIKVKPPFWKTWWFLGLVAFAAVGLFYWLDKQRTQKIRATESIRTRISTSLTEDMSNSLTSINISSELAKNKIDADTERTKEYISQISDASHRMVQSMYDMVWSINPGNDNLPDTIARMKEFAAEIENAHDVSLIFDVEKEVLKLKLDMENRYELLSIFKEAVTNAVRHANARHIQVSLRSRRPKLIMMVEDDGKGFENLQFALLGRGISDMRRRATAIDASLHIESNENTGSIIKLEMSI